MTDQPTRPVLSMVRLRAIAFTRIRRVMRTRIALAAAVFTLLPWGVVETHSLLGRLSALAEFSVVGLTTLAAGAVSDDLDSGEFAIEMSHDVSPFEVLLGNSVASLALAAVLIGAQLPLVFLRIPVPAPGPLVLCLVTLVLLLGGWLALMLLFATFLEGKANAIAMVVVLVIPFLVQLGVLTRLPRSIATISEHALRLLPRVDQATTVFGAVLYRSPIPSLDAAVLIISPFLYFALASRRLQRIEPAGRITR